MPSRCRRLPSRFVSWDLCVSWWQAPSSTEVFAIVFTDVATSSVLEAHEDGQQDPALLRQHFNGLERSMQTLFHCISSLGSSQVLTSNSKQLKPQSLNRHNLQVPTPLEDPESPSPALFSSL